MFGMMIDIGPEFYAVPSPPPYMTLRSKSQTFKLNIKVFRTSLFPNLRMDLVLVSHDDRYWSKILCSTFHTPHTWH